MKPRYRIGSAIAEVLVIAFAILFLLPLYLAVVAALKTPAESAVNPLALPGGFYVENFVDAWTQANMGPSLLISVLITVVSVLLLVVVGSLASFVLARRSSRISRGAYAAFLVGIILPFQLGSIPLYQLMRDAHLLGTPWSLIVFYLGTQLPLTVFIYTGFLRTIPRDFEEAALLDGAGQFRAFWLVVFPLLRPVTLTVVILNAVAIWNDFFTPLLYMAGAQRTLPVAVYSFVGQYSTQWNLIFAGVIISALPVVILFLSLQRAFLTSFGGALKG